MSQSVLAGLKAYWSSNGFGDDGGYFSPYVKFAVLDRFPMRLPNTHGRRAAVLLHDLHHLASGYRTDFGGELEIAAFEIGGGMGPYAAAWAYNLGAFASGLAVRPRAMFRAFVRGRQSRLLYAEREVDLDQLLGRSIESLQRQICPQTTSAPRLGDRLFFAAWVLVAVIGIAAAPLSVALWLVAANVPPPPRAPKLRPDMLV